MSDNSYTYLYFYCVAAFIPFILAYIIDNKRELDTNRYSFVLGIFLVLLVIIFFGGRSFNFGFDTIGYVQKFESEQLLIEKRYPFLMSKDFGYDLLNRLAAYIFSPREFLLLCSSITVFSFYIGYKRIFNDKALLPFYILCCCFFFWAFGTNVIRAGLGFSLFTLAVSLDRNKILQIIFFVLACSFHLSIFLCILAWLISSVLKPVKFYIITWVACFGLAILNFDLVTSFLQSVEEGNALERATVYATLDIDYRTGFRPDFVLFSFFFLALGIFFKMKVYSDDFYDKIVKAYILLNAVFLLSMNLAYSDRFAGLSWGLIPIIISYPLIKTENKNGELVMLGAGLAMTSLSLYLFRIT